MKTKLIAFVGVICLALSVQAVEKPILKGNTYSNLGDYEVVKADDQSNETFTTYILKYENSDEKFIVQVCKGDDCKNYVVYGKDFQLQYKAQDDNMFGMSKVDKKFRKFDKGTVAKRIDREQLYRQKVISTSEKTENQYLGLIACYLPQVIK